MRDVAVAWLLQNVAGKQVARLDVAIFEESRDLLAREGRAGAHRDRKREPRGISLRMIRRQDEMLFVPAQPVVDQPEVLLALLDEHRQLIELSHADGCL